MLYFKKILIFIKSLKTEYFKYTNLFNFKENFFIIFSNVNKYSIFKKFTLIE